MTDVTFACPVCPSKVTSKGAGLNPNAKVWQEMPVASSDAVASSHHWPPSDLSEGKSHPPSICSIVSVSFAALIWLKPFMTSPWMVGLGFGSNSLKMFISEIIHSDLFFLFQPCENGTYLKC